MGLRTPKGSSIPWRLRRLAALLTLCSFLAFLTFQSSHLFMLQNCAIPHMNGTVPSATIAQYFSHYNVHPNNLAELGARVQFLRGWASERSTPYPQTLERTLSKTFPFILRNSSSSPDQTAPFTDLLQSFDKDRGIVVTARSETFRTTAHVISNLRNVLNTTLPIEVAYFQDEDMPARYRDALLDIDRELEFFSIKERFNDESMQLAGAEEAMSPFAVLGSRFREVILIEGNTVFLQRPEVVLDASHGYHDTGVLLFRERGFEMLKDKWWVRQMRHHRLSVEMQKAMQRPTPAPGKSNVVVVDKRRLDVVMGLLHVCWQHTKRVRRRTFEATRGGRESWWAGMELSGVNYTFAEHFGVVPESGRKLETVVRVDDNRRLLWLDGGSSIKKPGKFEELKSWMLDGLSGMTKHNDITRGEKEVLDASARAAVGVNKRFKGLIQGEGEVVVEKKKVPPMSGGWRGKQEKGLKDLPKEGDMGSKPSTDNDKNNERKKILKDHPKEGEIVKKPGMDNEKKDNEKKILKDLPEERNTGKPSMDNDKNNERKKILKDRPKEENVTNSPSTDNEKNNDSKKEAKQEKGNDEEKGNVTEVEKNTGKEKEQKNEKKQGK